MIRAFGVSEPGPVRTTNEDRFVSDPRLGLFAVADGMGGHKAGEVAAELAIEAITSFIGGADDHDDDAWPYGLDAALSIDGNRLRTAIFMANRMVFRAAESRDEYGGMGTTIVGALVSRQRAAIASVGDSRVYLLSNGTLQQLTTDDSWAETMLSQDPEMRAEDLAAHPMRHVLTNVLGGRPTVDVHVTERVLVGGEVLLLCTDGVHGVLDAAVIQDVLARVADEALAARQIVDKALEAGSRDNVTALVVRYEADE